MGQVARKFEVVEGGCSIGGVSSIEQPIEQPLNNQDFWLFSDALEALANISQQAAGKAIKSRKWRGCELLVREVEIGRGGAGGMALQVHVDSLPSDLREAWYLERGIALHAQADPVTGDTIMVPKTVERDATHDKDFAEARWKYGLIAHIVKLEKGKHGGRKAAVLTLIANPVMTLAGKQKTVSRATVYNWINAYDTGRLHGLMRKARTDKGAKRKKVTRAWDRYFADQIKAGQHDAVAEALTHYIRSLWASGERG